jgi:hypothetical protein
MYLKILYYIVSAVYIHAPVVGSQNCLLPLLMSQLVDCNTYMNNDNVVRKCISSRVLRSMCRCR